MPRHQKTASGASGCVFIPSLTGNDVKVTKVFFRKADYDAEVAALALVDAIDAAHEFTVKGTAGRMAIDANTLAACGSTAFNSNNTGNYYVIHYDDAGVPLADLGAGADLCALVQLFKHVCDMNDAGFIHGDITPVNVAFKDGKFRLIDYGLLRPVEGVPLDKFDMWAIRNILVEKGVAAAYAIPLNYAGGPDHKALVALVRELLYSIC